MHTIATIQMSCENQQFHISHKHFPAFRLVLVICAMTDSVAVLETKAVPSVHCAAIGAGPVEDVGVVFVIHETRYVEHLAAGTVGYFLAFSPPVLRASSVLREPGQAFAVVCLAM